MRRLHEELIEQIWRESDRLLSRRSLLTAGGSAAVLAAGLVPLGAAPALAQGSPAPDAPLAFTDEVDVLNYALTLEHLEFAFYRDGIGSFTFGKGPFNEDIGAYLAAVRDHERAHVQALTKAITDLGRAPVAEGKYDFGYGSDEKAFLATAQALESTGVRAYDGVAQFLRSAQLVTVAVEIVAVEARHAAYLNLLNGALPFPNAFEDPASKAEVLQVVAPFVGGVGTPAA